MSYDVDQYVFLGCPLKNALKKTKLLDSEFPLKKLYWGSWLEESHCIVIDAKLESLFEKHASSLAKLFPGKDISFAQIVKVTDPSDVGSPSALLLAVMLLELGLPLLDYLDPESREVLDEAFSDGGTFTFIDSEFVGLRYEGDVVDTIATFSGDGLPAILAPLLSVKGLLTYTALTQYDDEDGETYPLSVSVNQSKFWPTDSSFDRFLTISKLILNTFLHTRDETHFEGTVGVVSTLFRDVHHLGGMIENIPYLVVSDNGEIFPCDDEGWDDPLETDPESIESIASALFDDSDVSIFQKYNPQFCR